MSDKSNGEELIRKTICRAGKPAALQVTLDRDILPANGRSVCQFEIALVDSFGTVVPNGDMDIQAAVTSGELLGMDNGNPVDHTLPKSPVRATHCGLAYGVLRAPRTPDELTITISAQGLKPVACTLLMS